MDYLQYENSLISALLSISSFKPCYKWITFNTVSAVAVAALGYAVCFKPCYKWITFNTNANQISQINNRLCFKPCYKWITFNTNFV